MSKSGAIVDAPDYEAAMSLLKEVRSRPFSGCAHTLECKASLWGIIWAISSFIMAIHFPDGRQRSIHSERTRGYWGNGLEEGDQRLESEQAATSHIGLLSSFNVYFPGMPPAPVFAANNAVQHCWACRAQCPQPATPGWPCPLALLSATVAASPALGCHTDCFSQPSSACQDVLDWSWFCMKYCLTLASSAALTLSHFLLQGLSSL